MVEGARQALLIKRHGSYVSCDRLTDAHFLG
jgi:hypothetical protein